MKDELPPKRRLAMVARLLRAMFAKPVPRTFPALEARNFPSLRGRLEILRDSNGIPHVYAEEEPDLFVAFGYLQAADRLLLVDTIRHIGAGRLCELIGNLPAPRGNELIEGRRVADLDRFVRPFGFEAQSAGDAARIEPEAARLLESFADGFNAALRAMGGVYPPEYVALGAVRPWSPADCLLTARTCAFVISVTGLENELTFDAVRGRLGDEGARRLYPEAPWDDVPTSYDASAAGAPEPPFHVPSGGSNNWAVGPSRSRSGAPIVGNDPHVPLLPLPTFWQHVHAECPGYRVQGGQLPGCPVFCFGHNGFLAWGVTHAFRDTFDLYRIHRLADDPSRYRVARGTGEITRHREEHATRLGPKVVLEWESCEHGVLFPDWKHHDGVDLALRVVPSDLARFFEGYTALPAARSVGEHRAALERIHEGPFDFNHVYGHRDGAIAWEVFGRVPRRAGDGLFVRDADDPRGQWDGVIPFAEMPKKIDPPAAFVATANSTVEPGVAAPLFTLVHCEPRYRQRQIESFLAAEQAHTAESFAALQSRVVSDYGIPLRDALLRVLDGTIAAAGLPGQALGVLREWDGTFSADSAAAAIFFCTQHQLALGLYPSLLGDELGVRFAHGRRGLPRLHRLLLDDADPLRDDVEEAAHVPFARVVRDAFVDAVRILGRTCGGLPREWRWGMVHRARLGTPLALLPFVGARIRVLDEPFPGDDYTVSPSRPVHVGNRFYAFVGATSRFICDLAKPDEALFAHTSGPSADVASAFHASLSRPWLRFEYFRSALWKKEEVPGVVERVVLTGH